MLILLREAFSLADNIILLMLNNSCIVYIFKRKYKINKKYFYMDLFLYESMAYSFIKQDSCEIVFLDVGQRFYCTIQRIIKIF